MTRNDFIMKTDIKTLLEERFGVQKKWDEWSRLNAFDVLLEQTPTIANIVYKKEEKDMNMKYSKCYTCKYVGNIYRCAICEGANMYATRGKQVEYNKPNPARRWETYTLPQIRNVIFSGRATIVFWEDNTKTVVKCDKEDIYDPHTGLAEAIAKKTLGDDYRRLFRKYIKQYNKQKESEEKTDAVEIVFEGDKWKTAIEHAIEKLCKDDAE